MRLRLTGLAAFLDDAAASEATGAQQDSASVASNHTRFAAGEGATAVCCDRTCGAGAGSRNSCGQDGAAGLPRPHAFLPRQILLPGYRPGCRQPAHLCAQVLRLAAASSGERQRYVPVCQDGRIRYVSGEWCKLVIFWSVTKGRAEMQHAIRTLVDHNPED